MLAGGHNPKPSSHPPPNLTRNPSPNQVFLSGCSSMLVVAGPTYTQRLWCIMEIFTFTFMGGELNRITFLPISDAPAGTGAEGSLVEESLKPTLEAFATFDANAAKCFKPEEKQALLGVIQSGAGSISAFNETVRRIFAGVQSESAACLVGPESSASVWRAKPSSSDEIVQASSSAGKKFVREASLNSVQLGMTQTRPSKAVLSKRWSSRSTAADEMARVNAAKTLQARVRGNAARKMVLEARAALTVGR